MSATVGELALLSEAALHHAQRGRPYEAHHLWEAAWRQEPEGPSKRALRGLIQRCAAAHNVTQDSGDGRKSAAAQRQLERANEHLSAFSSVAHRLGLSPSWNPTADRDASTLSWPSLSAHAAVDADVLLIGGGHGRRAGGPKALKQVDGLPLWRWQRRRLHALGAAVVVAVLHPRATLPQATAALIAVHADPDQQMMGSIHRAIAALPPDERPVFLLPVDCPCPPRPVWTALMAAAKAADMDGTRWDALRPTSAHSERSSGHPVLLHRSLCHDLLAGDPQTDRLDHVLREREAVFNVTVDTDAIFANFNRDGVSR